MEQLTEISLQDKAGVYAFLKVVFSTEPSPDLLKYLQTPQVLESLQASGIPLVKEELELSGLTKLKEDYTRLFIGPGEHIALNEAVYTGGTPQFWGEVTVRIKKLIEYLGLELDENWTRMPDHIAVEFELMQKILEAKIKASQASDHHSVQQCDKAITGLFEGHIIRWVPKVCDQVIDRAQTSCYRAVGLWTQMFIQHEEKVCF